MPGERHPQIRPPHTRVHLHEPPVRRLILALHAQRDATRAAPPREVTEGAGHLRELLLVPQHHLENAQLLARATLDERHRMRQREAVERPVRSTHNYGVAYRQLVVGLVLPGVVVARRQRLEQRLALAERGLLLERRSARKE